MNYRQQRGVAYLSTLIALPVLGALIGGAIQLGLIYQAKAVLNHAVLTAARTGATNNADPQAINNGLARGLAPLYVSGTSYLRAQGAIQTRVRLDILGNSCVRILNPNREAFRDHDVTNADPLRDNTISIYELNTLPITIGAVSGTSIQDAMILQLYVVYGARASVPVIGPLLTRLIAIWGDASGYRLRLLLQGRIPIESQAIVRMSSSARLSDMVESRSSDRFSC